MVHKTYWELLKESLEWNLDSGFRIRMYAVEVLTN